MSVLWLYVVCILGKAIAHDNGFSIMLNGSWRDSSCFSDLSQISDVCFCCRKKRRVFWSCYLIRRSLAPRRLPRPPWTQNRPLLVRCFRAQWPQTPSRPPAPLAASSPSLLSSPLLPRRHCAPPQPRSLLIGGAAPSTAVLPLLLLLASPALLSCLSTRMHGPLFVKGTLTTPYWWYAFAGVPLVPFASLSDSACDCPPQVQGGGVVSSPERGGAGAEGGRHCVCAQEERGRLVQRHAAEERQDRAVPRQLRGHHLTHSSSSLEPRNSVSPQKPNGSWHFGPQSKSERAAVKNRACCNWKHGGGAHTTPELVLFVGYLYL